jgi:hypothetical protein
VRASAVINTASASAPALSPSAVINPAVRPAGAAGSDNIGAIVESASARRAGTRSSAPALSIRRASLMVPSRSSFTIVAA